MEKFKITWLETSITHSVAFKSPVDTCIESSDAYTA